MKKAFKLYIAIWLLISFNSCVNDEVAENLPEPPESALIEEKNEQETPFLEDELIYEFINEIDLIGESSILQSAIFDMENQMLNFGTDDSISSNYSVYLEPTFFLVDQKDSAYFQEQVNKGKDQIWDHERLKAQEIWDRYNFWIITHSPFDWDEFKKAGFGCFVSLGIPIFNKNRDVAVIYVGFQCHGTLGSGSFKKYKKVNGKWQFDDEANLWIS